MRISDYIQQALFALANKKLRTCLTVGGITISIGALVCMLAFGHGVQKNITDTFAELELFNYLNVYPHSKFQQSDPDAPKPTTDETVAPRYVIDDEFVNQISTIEGVEMAFPTEHFTALVQFDGKEEFAMVQVLPAYVCNSNLLKLKAGKAYETTDSNSIIISASLLNRMGIKDIKSVISREIQLSTVTMDLSISNMLNVISSLQKGLLAFTPHTYSLTIEGIMERPNFFGPVPFRSDVYISPAASKKIKKLPITNLSDIFQSEQTKQGYDAVVVRISRPQYLDSVRSELTSRGVKVFAMADHLEEMKIGFLMLDAFLLAISMIGITVSSLGIINTMLMSVLERYREIGIFKAVGATNRNIQMLFLFESGIIGLFGGLLGLVLGYAVSLMIKFIITNIVKEMPDAQIFFFSFWICAGAVLFSVIISLVSGTYPAMRAAGVDPIKALHHE